jgi:cystathionine beta-lyase
LTRKTATLLTHAGADPDAFHGAVNVPAHRMSTVVFKSYKQFLAAEDTYEGAAGPYTYGRVGTPSSAAFESAIAKLEGAHNSLTACSGLAAILTALTAFTKAGGHVLMPDNCYGPNRRACDDFLRKYGVEVEYYPPLTKNIAKHFRRNTQLVFVEAPGSLTFEVPDVGGIIAAAKEARIKVAMDNSWATPLLLKPLALGADVSVMSATKYLSGHSDLVMGVVSATKDAWPAVKRAAIVMGQCAGADELYLALRGLRTLEVRLKRQEQSAFELARWLEKHPAVKAVRHPALSSCPGHANWKKYYRGASGTFGVILKETGEKKAAAMLERLELFRMGLSWGGFESLVFPKQPGPSRTAEKWKEKGFLLRLHIGLEDVEDLKADLARALKSA